MFWVFYGSRRVYHPERGRGIELGWMLFRSYRGKGYAAEAANAAIQFISEKRKKEKVIALIHPKNEASLKVAQHLGAAYEETIEVDGIENLCFCFPKE